jgi:hypothetical protein
MKRRHNKGGHHHGARYNFAKSKDQVKTICALYLIRKAKLPA